MYRSVFLKAKQDLFQSPAGIHSAFQFSSALKVFFSSKLFCKALYKYIGKNRRVPQCAWNTRHYEHDLECIAPGRRRCRRTAYRPVHANARTPPPPALPPPMHFAIFHFHCGRSLIPAVGCWLGSAWCRNAGNFSGLSP